MSAIIGHGSILLSLINKSNPLHLLSKYGFIPSEQNEWRDLDADEIETSDRIHPAMSMRCTRMGETSVYAAKIMNATRNAYAAAALCYM